NEQAVTGRVDEGGSRLEGAAHRGFTFAAERVRFAADAQNFRADCITRGMVRTHGGGGVGDANALDCARLVRGHRLAFDGRYAANAENLARGLCAAAQDTTGWRALAHLFDQLNSALAVAK